MTAVEIERLRAGARAMRAVIPMTADALDADADRLERGESVTDLAESLALADAFAEQADR